MRIKRADDITSIAWFTHKIPSIHQKKIHFEKHTAVGQLRVRPALACLFTIL